MATETDELITRLWRLGFSPPAGVVDQPVEIPVERMLWQIVQAKEAQLLPGFTLLIAHRNAHKIPIDVEGLVVNTENTAAERRCMSQMLLISLQLLKALNQEVPIDLNALQVPLQMAHGDLLNQSNLPLANGIDLDVALFRQAVSAHLCPTETNGPTDNNKTEAPPPLLERHLKRLFAPKQIELIHKKLNHQPLTKTEREYYSRVVRKRLAAIADRELHDTARLIIFGAR